MIDWVSKGCLAFFLLGWSLSFTACSTSNELVPNLAPVKTLPELVEVTGKVVGHDGKPIKMAHVKVGIRWVEIASDGTFSLQLIKNRLIPLRFTGLMHRSFTVRLLTAEPDIQFKLQLGTPELAKTMEKPEVVLMQRRTSVPGYQEGKRTKMISHGSGKWSVDVPLTEGRGLYKIKNALESGENTIQGTSCSRYLRDEAHGYVSEVESTQETVKITFDPALLPPSNLKPKLSFAKPHAVFAKIAQLKKEMADYQRKYRRDKKEAKKGEETAQTAGVRSWMELIQTRLLSAEPIPTHLRHVLLMAYFNLPIYRLEDGKSTPPLQSGRWLDEAFQSIEPTSPLWGFSSSATRLISQHASMQFLEAVKNQNPDEEIAAAMAFSLLQQAAWKNLEGKQKAYFDQLDTTYAHTTSGIKFVTKKDLYQPDHPFKKGKPVPGFSLASFDSNGEELKPSNYRGSHLLIEVWGTWCGPCISDMGKLHDIHKELSPKGLKMLSIAVFDSEDKVTKHRKEWPMPWDHAVLSEVDSDLLMGSFKAMGVPSYILVGPDGLVLEKGFAWRNSMKPILRTYLEKKAP